MIGPDRAVSEVGTPTQVMNFPAHVAQMVNRGNNMLCSLEPGSSHVIYTFCTAVVAQNVKISWEFPGSASVNKQFMS